MSRNPWRAYGWLHLVRAMLRGPMYLGKFLLRRKARRGIGRWLRQCDAWRGLGSRGRTGNAAPVSLLLHSGLAAEVLWNLASVASR